MCKTGVVTLSKQASYLQNVKRLKPHIRIFTQVATHSQSSTGKPSPILVMPMKNIMILNEMNCLVKNSMLFFRLYTIYTALAKATTKQIIGWDYFSAEVKSNAQFSSPAVAFHSALLFARYSIAS